MNETERMAFEAEASAPPYEKNLARWPDDQKNFAWPGQYKDIAVEFAWEMWQAARAAAPASEVRRFAAAILHGDARHRAWLTDAAEAFNTGQQLPAPSPVAAPPEGWKLVPMTLSDAEIKKIENHGVWGEHEVRNLYADIMNAVPMLGHRPRLGYHRQGCSTVGCQGCELPSLAAAAPVPLDSKSDLVRRLRGTSKYLMTTDDLTRLAQEAADGIVQAHAEITRLEHLLDNLHLRP